MRSGENNENKYVPRVERARSLLAPGYACYIEIDFTKNENVFSKNAAECVADRMWIGTWCRVIVDGTIISFLAPLPFSVDRESRS